MSGIPRISYIECETDRDRFRVADAKIGKLLELVRRPVSEIERTRGTELERIAPFANVTDVELGRPANQRVHRHRLETIERVRGAFDLREEIAISNQRDLDCLDVTGRFPRVRQDAQEFGVVDDGKGRRKRADEIFLSKSVHGIFDADAAIGLT